MNEQKLKRIEDYVEEHDNVSMTALCNEFNISMSTLRRAVTVLCERGTINKSYGRRPAATRRSSSRRTTSSTWTAAPPPAISWIM